MSVQIDVLDDVLNTIRLNGTAYFQKVFAGNWGIETKATPFKKFQIIVDGECWLRTSFLEEPLALHSGDIVAFPHGSPYRLSTQVESPCVVIDEESLNDATLFAEGAVSTTIVFGHIEFTRDFNHPFMRDLPLLIHIRAGDTEVTGRLRSIANLIAAELQALHPGSGSVLKRLAEVLHLYTLRAHILAQHGVGSYPAAFNEPPIYRALQLVHQDLATPWTLEHIAREVNMSRTLFATQFKEVMGMPPMRYITLWRMQKARELLETTYHPLFAIAIAVGYGSEAAFSHAFQREFNETPGLFRQKMRNL